MDSTVLIPPENQFRIGSEPEFVNLLRSPELVFLNLYGAQESMPRHQFRQPM
jgi:hypothetical protein